MEESASGNGQLAKKENVDTAGLIKLLGMEPHPEGGYLVETHRSTEQVDSECKTGKRSAGTHSYYMLVSGEYSSWHKLQSDELWHAYLGGPTLIYELDNSAPNGVRITRLGKDFLSGERPIHMVKRGTWFGARLGEEASFSLVGTTVMPGFEFVDFEQAKTVEQLQEMFPNTSVDILKLLIVKH